MESLVWAQPTYGEEALDIVDIMAASGGVDLSVLDSVSALVPQAELTGDMSDMMVSRYDWQCVEASGMFKLA
jgi:recombination protein RecA